MCLMQTFSILGKVSKEPNWKVIHKSKNKTLYVYATSLCVGMHTKIFVIDDDRKTFPNISNNINKNDKNNDKEKSTPDFCVVHSRVFGLDVIDS